MQIFHIAFGSDWEQARRDGSYTVSTRGATLDDIGYLHCALDHQVDQVRRLLYEDVLDELVLLTIDTDRLASPWRMDRIPHGDRSFPHIYGPLNTDAVVDVRPLTQSRGVLQRLLASLRRR